MNGFQSTPRITIITATLNCEHQLRKTAESISSQTGPRPEWIISDGGSSDGTIDAIRSFRDMIHFWRSERDSGIYDAWNKAIPHASGEWIAFLGAGDELASPETTTSFATALSKIPAETEIVYGDVALTTMSGDLIELEGREWSEMVGRWKWRLPMLPLHPGVLYRSRILTEKAPFDPRFRIAGDNHFLLRNILARPPIHIPATFSRMPVGGTSANLGNTLAIAREFSLIIDDLDLSPPFAHSVADWCKIAAKMFLQYALPRKIGLAMLDFERLLRGRPSRWRDT